MENITTLIDRFYKTHPVEKWKNYGFFNDKYIHVINYHWLQFDPPLRSSYLSLALLYIIIMIVGWTGNVCVIYLYYRNRVLRTSGNMLVANLAISDLMLLSKMPIFIYNSFLEGPALGDIACRIYGLVGGLTGNVSICTLSAIALDRFYVIKYPLNRAFSSLRVKICLGIVWGYGLFFAIIPSLNIGLGQYTPEGYLTSCSFDYLSPEKEVKIFILVYFCAAWILPFAIITFSYAHILNIVLARSMSTKQQRESFRHIREENQRKQEIKLSLTVLSVIFLWFAAWTPYSVVALLGVSGHKELITPICSMIPALFCKTASAIDPYVYALSHPKFKEELFAMFKRSKTKTSSKITTISKRPKKIAVEVNDEISEVENIELISIPGFTSQKEPPVSSNIDTGENLRKCHKNFSITEMICFRPTFSNKSTSIRRIARRWSLKQ